MIVIILGIKYKNTTGKDLVFQCSESMHDALMYKVGHLKDTIEKVSGFVFLVLFENISFIIWLFPKPLSPPF